MGSNNTDGQILQALNLIRTDTLVIANATPSGAQTVTSTTATDSTGSPISAGATEISFTTNASFVGTINGVARNASTVYVLESASGKTLPSIPYTVTGGSMVIDKTA